MTARPPALWLPANLLLGVAQALGGTVRARRAELGWGVAASLLLELALDHRVTVHETEVAVRNAARVPDPVADAFLEDLILSRGRPPHYWVERSGPWTLEAVRAQLTAAGLMRPVPHRWFNRFFPVSGEAVPGAGRGGGPSASGTAPADPRADLRIAALAALTGALDLPTPDPSVTGRQTVSSAHEHFPAEAAATAAVTAAAKRTLHTARTALMFPG
jgi:hypothetical protein